MTPEQKTDIREFCKKHDACSEGKKWALKNCANMAEAWQTARPDWLIWIATREGVLDDRALRLFACWSVRQVWHLLTDARSRNAVEVAERFANGEATEEELAAAWAAAWAANAAASDAACAAARGAACDAAWATRSAARAAAWAASDAASDAARAAAWAATREKQAAWIRTSYPNPFTKRKVAGRPKKQHDPEQTKSEIKNACLGLLFDYSGNHAATALCDAGLLNVPRSPKTLTEAEKETKRSELYERNSEMLNDMIDYGEWLLAESYPDFAAMEKRAAEVEEKAQRYAAVVLERNQTIASLNETIGMGELELAATKKRIEELEISIATVPEELTRPMLSDDEIDAETDECWLYGIPTTQEHCRREVRKIVRHFLAKPAVFNLPNYPAEVQFQTEESTSGPRVYIRKDVYEAELAKAPKRRGPTP